MTISLSDLSTGLFEHQQQEFDKTKDFPHWAHFWEMGTGKSVIVIRTLAYLFFIRKVERVVIFAKAGEYRNWPLLLFPDHWPKELALDTFTYDSYKIATKSNRAVFDEFKVFDKNNIKFKVLFMNIEALGGAKGPEILEHFYNHGPKRPALIVDESTCIKNYKAKRSKELYRWAKRSSVRRILTGTPATESPMDLWGQSLVLGRGLLGTTSYTAFKEEYCKQEVQFFGARAVKTITGYKNLEQLSELLKGFSTQILKKDCLDLPEKIYTKRVITLTADQDKLYKQLKDEAIAEYGDKVIEVTNALALTTKLHQIICGQVKVNDEYLSVHSNRIDVLVEILEDYPGKVIIWCPYVQALRDIVKALKTRFGAKSTAMYAGETSLEDRDKALTDFQDPSSPLKYFVGNQAVAGYGLTLTAANLVIYYANSWRAELRYQSEDRPHRIGQTENVTYIDFICPGTIDERIIDALREKKKLADLIQSRPLSEWI